MKSNHLKTMILSIFFSIIFVASPSCETGKKPILIGATVSLEGKYSEISFMLRNAYNLWIEHANKRGGLLGRPVKLILSRIKQRLKLFMLIFCAISIYKIKST